MTKSIKITRTALTVQISFDKGDISLTFQDEKVLTMFNVLILTVTILSSCLY